MKAGGGGLYSGHHLTCQFGSSHKHTSIFSVLFLQASQTNLFTYYILPQLLLILYSLQKVYQKDSNGWK